MTKRKGRKRNRTPELESFEPKLYLEGLKLFLVEFDYAYDIAIPSLYPINIRLPKRPKNEVGSVLVERINGSVSIDSARVSVASKNLTKSARRIPFKTPIITVELQNTQPLHYRIHKYAKVVAPVYRSKITVRFYDTSRTMSDVMKLATEFFNQYLKAYRVASGDPVPYAHEDKKELRVAIIKYQPLSPEEQQSAEDIEWVLKNIQKFNPSTDGGMSMGFSTNEFDMAPKPYQKYVALKTVEYGLLPENMPFYNEPIIEAIEMAHRRNEYGLGIVLLNVAFEAAITFQLLVCLAFLGYDEKESEKFIMNDNKDLEDKRKVFDDVREKALTKYGLPKVKRFRGSAEEGKWNSTTYKKRHVVVHITNAKSSKITKEEFRAALEATQAAIKLLDVPVEDLKKARKQQKDSSHPK